MQVQTAICYGAIFCFVSFAGLLDNAVKEPKVKPSAAPVPKSFKKSLRLVGISEFVRDQSLRLIALSFVVTFR